MIYHFFQPSQPSQPSQSSQKNILLSLPFTKDIPTLYEERRISEQSPKYNRLIIISKPEKYTTSSGFSLPSGKVCDNKVRE